MKKIVMEYKQHIYKCVASIEMKNHVKKIVMECKQHIHKCVASIET